MIGAKKCPEQDIKEGELVLHETMALGTSSYRSGFGQSESQDLTKKIFAMNPHLSQQSRRKDNASTTTQWSKNCSTDQRHFMMLQVPQEATQVSGV